MTNPIRKLADMDPPPEWKLALVRLLSVAVAIFAVWVLSRNDVDKDILYFVWPLVIPAASEWLTGIARKPPPDK